MPVSLGQLPATFSITVFAMEAIGLVCDFNNDISNKCNLRCISSYDVRYSKCVFIPLKPLIDYSLPNLLISRTT